MRRSGLQAEVILSLALVMLAATAVLAGVLLRHGEARLRDVLGRALLAEALQAPQPEPMLLPGTRWWRLRADGSVEPAGADPDSLDARTRALASSVRERRMPLLQPGAPWEEIRFGAPAEPDGVVAVARLPRSASLRLRAAPLGAAAIVLLVDVAIFTAFGVSLLRRRVVLPLRRLAEAAGAVADGELANRVPVEGPREAAEVATAFNQMTAALERRTGALEKVVAELREANRSLRHARAGLARAERLAAVGRLAAGVAHEVGNPVAAQLAFLDLARRDPACAPETREHLARAAQQGERVRRILRQLLEFSRPPRRAAAVALDLRALAEETVALVEAQRRYGKVRFQVRQEGALPSVRGDPGAVSQILLNLALNAADAVRDADDPRVEIRVRPAVLDVRDGEGAEAAAGRRVPDAVECLVADHGCGIPEEDRERIFDPFFTSKAPGEGTGLGLATSQRLAEELGGRLELAPPPAGARTAFALRLPAVLPTPAQARP